ncbi:MAG TPA: hypothetical protein VNN17_01580, partial [Terriglobia bacterium]|nr:hypothetical protein [Terriglobia bacterium]
MGPTLTSYGRPFPRRQAQRLVELLSRPESALQAVLTARRREGKSDLLVQIQAALFDKADGPMPFRYVFDPRRAPDALARHFAASFCQQMRAFVMRQPEMLGEPLALLERELERPGLPLALTELGREYLALSSSARLEFAATLPGQFAYQEGRPLCLLLDNAETLEVFPELLSTLDDPRLSWLLTGRCRPLRRLAGRRGWPLLPLEPFALEEAMALASERCRQFEMPWVASAWQDWFAIAGTSPEWVDRLIESAAAAGRRLDSLEDLGRAYVRESAGGGMGQLFQERWQTVFADRGVAAEASLAGVREASHVAARLLQPQGGMLEPEAVPPGVRDGLAAEEWIVETPLGDAVRLSTVERDWLELARNTARFGAQRAEAGLLQAFLARAEGARQWRQAGDAVQEIRTGLLALPGLAAGEGRSPRLPELCS